MKAIPCIRKNLFGIIKFHFKNKTEQFTLMPNAFVNYKGNLEGLDGKPSC